LGSGHWETKLRRRE